MSVLIVDTRERRSNLPTFLGHLDVELRVEQLGAGDYVLPTHWAMERKTVRDLHLAVIQGRFWRQLHQLRRTGLRPYLLVEGRNLDAGKLRHAAIRGVLLSVADLGVSIIRTDDPTDSARWIAQLVRRSASVRVRDRPVYAQRPMRTATTHAAERALSAADGVSAITARAVLERFGSLRAVATASALELREVPGVGPTRAAAIAAMINDKWSARTAL